MTVKELAGYLALIPDDVDVRVSVKGKVYNTFCIGTSNGKDLCITTQREEDGIPYDLQAARTITMIQDNNR